MNNFLLSTASQQEIQSLDNKVHETVELINQYKVNREFFLGFARDPQQFINKWLVSQNRDLKVGWSFTHSLPLCATTSLQLSIQLSIIIFYGYY